ncbi:MAG: UDP-glucose 4-epimerase GalE [Deltaproteobacteria bacterium]|nr:UDP-glucose 4-epimerase GalE [Deltaproteobacteria bacterium]
MRVLVTGGAGYVGSVVSEELLAAGHEVVVYDDLSRGHRAAVPRRAQLVVADLADRATLEATLRSAGSEAVLHFAALIEAGESMRAPERFFRVNVAGSLTLLEAMLATGVGQLVFSSTAALYGDPEELPLRESSPLRPTSPYGASKHMVEEMLSWWHRVHGLRYAALRYFNAAGATPERGEDHRPESHLIPNLLEVARGGRAHATVFGTDYPTADGTCVRDYVHVSDLACAHVAALEALAGGDGRLIYNLGSGTGFTVRQVIDEVRRVTGHAIPVVEAARRPGDPAVLVASAEAAQRELGWRPQRSSLEAIVSSAWAWRLAHPDGYR